MSKDTSFVKVKTNRTDRYNLFENKARGLSALAASGVIQVPKPICFGRNGRHAYLVLEYLSSRSPDDRTRAGLGRQLAAQHRVVNTDFGWYWQNTIGTAPQQNNHSQNWERSDVNVARDFRSV